MSIFTPYSGTKQTRYIECLDYHAVQHKNHAHNLHVIILIHSLSSSFQVLVGCRWSGVYLHCASLRQYGQAFNTSNWIPSPQQHRVMGWACTVLSVWLVFHNVFSTDKLGGVLLETGPNYMLLCDLLWAAFVSQRKRRETLFHTTYISLVSSLHDNSPNLSNPI